MNNNILLLGSTGQVGSELLYLLDNVICLDRSEFDLEKINDDNISYLNKFKINCIINAAAYTDVDGAESDRQRAFQINYGAVRVLANYAVNNNIKLVQYSSDFVFDSADSHKTHKENDATTNNPGVYTDSKLKMEEYLINLKKLNFLLIRTSWVYGNSKNFVRTIQTLLERGQKIEVIADAFGAPTSANSVARATKQLLEKEKQGVFNFSNTGGPISWYEFAKQIEEYSFPGKNLIFQTSTIDFLKKQNINKKQISKRPKNSTMDLGKFTKELYAPENWRSELKKYIDKERNKLVIFPGSFDPFHKGHLRVVENLAKDKRTTKILIIPRIKSAHKESLAAFETRVELIRATLNSSKLTASQLSKIEIKRIDSPKEYNLNLKTIIELKREYKEHTLELILGADVVEQFNSWDDSRNISSLLKVRTADLVELNNIKVSSGLFKADKKNYKTFVPKSIYDKIISDGVY